MAIAIVVVTMIVMRAVVAAMMW